MKAHGKKLFTGIEQVRGFFLFDISSVHEIEHPFRKCRYAVFLHFWPGKALVLGVWGQRKASLEAHLIEALDGRKISVEHFQQARRFNSRHEEVPKDEEEGKNNRYVPAT